jgi:hypothetical protein
MLDFATFNWLAIVVATVVAFMIGGLWYGPLFGQAWLDALGKTQEDIEPSPTPFVVSAVTSFLTSVAMAMVLSGLGVATAPGGAAVGALVGVAFIAAAMGSDAAFCGWGVKLWAIQSGYRAVYAVVMGAILGGWT